MAQEVPGDESEAVLLGCLVNGHLRVWRSDGRVECVRLLHPSAFRALLARGVAPRTSLEPGRFREFGRLHASNVLVIANRAFAVEICEEPAVTEELWAAAIEVFQDAAATSIARGEYIVLEPGGWVAQASPYALAGAKRTPGEWLLHVEAVPAPRAPSWPEPPEGQAGWGVAAPAEPEALATLGILLAEAVSMWAHSPLDVGLTFGKQPDGPWPAEQIPASIRSFLDDIRSDIDELHTTRQLSRARDLSRPRTGVRFNHNTYPVFFTGDLRSPLVLVHHNPQQPANDAAQYEGGFEYAGFDEYLERHRKYGHYRWELGDDYPSPIDHKQMRFLRHWGVIDFVDGDSREDQRTNVARAADRKLQLELIPYGSPSFPTGGLPPEVLESLFVRVMRVVVGYRRDYVLLCGVLFESLFAPYILEREDHSFRLPTSTGTSRVEYRFSNLVLAYDGTTVPAGLVQNFASPGVPMDAYGQTCHELYRDIRR